MIRYFLSIVNRYRNHYNRWNFLFREQFRHEEISIGRNVTFNVPIYSGGAGRVLIGDNNRFGFDLSPKFGNGAIMLQARTMGSRLELGSGNCINCNSVICAVSSIRIGNRCLVGDAVMIFDSDFHAIDPELRHTSTGTSKPVCIGDNVWIGSRAVILKGVEIGENSVVAAMSVVTKSIPKNSLVAGNPAQIIRPI